MRYAAGDGLRDVGIALLRRGAVRGLVRRSSAPAASRGRRNDAGGLLVRRQVDARATGRRRRRPPSAAGTRSASCRRRCAPGRRSTRPRRARRRTCRTSNPSASRRARVAEPNASRVVVRLHPAVDRHRAGAAVAAVECRSRCGSRATTTVISLNVEPGAYCPAMARLSSGSLALGCGERGVVGRRDAADEQLRVVGRIAGGGEDPARCSGPSRRRRPTSPACPACARVGLICCASDCSASCLELSVDARDQRVALPGAVTVRRCRTA